MESSVMNELIDKIPRKSPSQKRAHDLVETIYEATVRILNEQAVEKTSTRHIAARAGVSVGSLYQYFPNREAILGSLFERIVRSNVEKLEGKLDEIKDQTLEAKIDFIVAEIASRFLRNKRVVSVLFDQIFKVGRMKFLLTQRNLATQLVKKTLEQHRQELPSQDLDLMAFVTVNAVMGVIQLAVYDSSRSRPEEAIIRETSVLAKAYLLRAKASCAES
jgi:AcrR family transcriptional regulator